MTLQTASKHPEPRSRAGRPVPIVALDVASASEALALVERLPRAGFFKVGLQLFTAAGPEVVRTLRSGGCRVFLDLKLHDIPNTVARAVESSAALGVELLTLHGAGGRAMLRAARVAAGEPGDDGPELFAVTALTSLSADELAEAWGRSHVDTESEVARLAALAREERMDGVVASVHEVRAIRERAGNGLRVLTPGIRLAGDAVGDQNRVATPAAAARRGADYLVVGRSVTAASDPTAAFDRVLDEIEAGAREDAVG